MSRVTSDAAYKDFIGSEPMKRAQPPIVIEIANTTAFDGRGSVILVEYEDDEAAVRAAHKIAEETGRSVKVTNTETGQTEIITSTPRH